MTINKIEPEYGTIAKCSLDTLGVISVSEKREVEYGGGSTGIAWTGQHLERRRDLGIRPGDRWSSRSPDPVSHVAHLGFVLGSMSQKTGEVQEQALGILPYYAAWYGLRQGKAHLSEQIVGDLLDWWDDMPPHGQTKVRDVIRAAVPDHSTSVFSIDLEADPDDVWREVLGQSDTYIPLF